MIRCTTFLYFLFLVLSACKSKHHSFQPADQPIKPSEKMVFLIFSIKEDSVQGSNIELIGKKIIVEKLKSEPENYNFETRLVVKQLNSRQQELSFCAIEHPLLRRFEYVTEEGKLESKIGKLKEAEFFVRVTLRAETAYIRVEEIIEGKQIKETTFKIID